MLNFVRERKEHVYGMNLLGVSALVQSLKTQLRRVLPSKTQYLNTNYLYFICRPLKKFAFLQLTLKRVKNN